MKRNIALILLAFVVSMTVVSCSDYEYPGKSFTRGERIEKLQDAVAERIKEGGSVRDIVMPPTAVMVSGVFLVIITVAGFFLVVAFYGKLSHKRTVLMIEKGIYQPVKKRWDIITLLIGLILSFVGVGVSVTTAAYFGPQPWTILSGVIPLFLGIAFLIFSRIFGKSIDR